MTKKEHTLNSLSSAHSEMKEVCNKLICSPSLKEKAEALCEEIQKEYEKSFDELHE